MTTSLTHSQKNSAISFFQNKALLNRLRQQLQDIFQFTENDPKVGFSFGLSAQYLIEQRQHGFSGGQGYLSWLKSLLNMNFSRSLITGPTTSIAEVEDILRHQFRLRYLSQTLLNLHPDGIILYGTPISSSQSSEIPESFSKARIQFYANHLRTSGLMVETPSGEAASPLKFSVKKNYVDFMESLRAPAENQYFLLFTTADTMAITYQKTENGAFWSFFNPDEGTYLYNNYENFKNDIGAYFFNTPDSGQRFYDSQIKERASIKYARFSEANTLLYDKTWPHFTRKEEVYVIDQFIERKIKLPFNKNTTVRLLGRTLNAEGHVAAIRIQLIDYHSSSEVRLTEVDAPFSTTKDLHLALLDPLNPFCGDFKSVAPDVVDVSNGEKAKARFWIFFDSKMHPYFEIQSDEQEHILPSRIRKMYDEMLISRNATDLPKLYSIEKTDTYYYSSGDFTLTKLPYKRIELYEDTPPIYASAPRILEDKIHPGHLNKKLQKYSHLNVQVVDSDFHYFKPSTLFGIDDICDANNRHQNSSSVKKMSLINVEPDTDTSALFDFGDGNE